MVSWVNLHNWKNVPKCTMHPKNSYRIKDMANGRSMQGGTLLPTQHSGILWPYSLYTPNKTFSKMPKRNILSTISIHHIIKTPRRLWKSCNTKTIATCETYSTSLSPNTKRRYKYFNAKASHDLRSLCAVNPRFTHLYSATCEFVYDDIRGWIGKLTQRSTTLESNARRRLFLNMETVDRRQWFVQDTNINIISYDNASTLLQFRFWNMTYFKQLQLKWQRSKEGRMKIQAQHSARPVRPHTFIRCAYKNIAFWLNDSITLKL